jgi:cyclic pyranopterin phosphate synthase
LTGLSDSFHRPVNYLRISVTDRCNLRCVYCMPPEGVPLLSHQDVLTYEEICTVAQAASELGMNKVRLTGGEPLVRAGLVKLVSMLTQIRGVDEIALTTNGVLLERFVPELVQAGLRRVNVSLDSLRSDRFAQITRVGQLDDVLRGIEAARSAGLKPVKTNTVVMRGINDDEVMDFAKLTLESDWHARFIEHMPFANGDNNGELLVPASEIRRRVETLGSLEPTLPSGGGPAKYFRLPDARGTIGFITPVSDHFCEECNRLRLTADGKLRTCLFSDEEVDLREPLRNGATVADLKVFIREAVSRKPRMHRLRAGVTCKRIMTQIGG